MCVQTVLIVDVTFWLVLAPMMLATPDPVKAARFHRIFFSFSSYNQHIVNFFLVYVELFLCNIPFAFAKISVVGAYSVSYSLWAILVFLVSGHWLYPVRHCFLSAWRYVFALGTQVLGQRV